jgi:hypothetical protein
MIRDYGANHGVDTSNVDSFDQSNDTIKADNSRTTKE